jgi:hypothetical protein
VLAPIVPPEASCGGTIRQPPWPGAVLVTSTDRAGRSSRTAPPLRLGGSSRRERCCTASSAS